MATPCIVADLCKNAPQIEDDPQAKCALCRLSPDNKGRDMGHYWFPTEVARLSGDKKHPALEAEKRTTQGSISAVQVGSKAFSGSKRRGRISRLAQKAEKATEKKIIHATKNSGRQNKDGDHVLYESVTLDTKLQSNRKNPVIFLEELEKVRKDAHRAKTMIGGLVIRNKHGVGCVVFREEDLPNICATKEVQ